MLKLKAHSGFHDLFLYQPCSKQSYYSVFITFCNTAVYIHVYNIFTCNIFFNCRTLFLVLLLIRKWIFPLSFRFLPSSNCMKTRTAYPTWIPVHPGFSGGSLVLKVLVFCVLFICFLIVRSMHSVACISELSIRDSPSIFSNIYYILFNCVTRCEKTLNWLFSVMPKIIQFSASPTENNIIYLFFLCIYFEYTYGSLQLFSFSSLQQSLCYIHVRLCNWMPFWLRMHYYVIMT
jgi:hypothetical protein